MPDDDFGSCVEWLYKLIGYCAYSESQVAAFFLGYISIGCWFCAQTPQLYKNYKLGQVEALNGLFLILWLLGDVFNLVGAVLTSQLQTQIILAAYFCSLDFCLMVQFFYYKAKSIWQKWAIIEAHEDGDENGDEDEEQQQQQEEYSKLLAGSPKYNNHHHLMCGCFVPVPLSLALQGNIPEVGDEPSMGNSIIVIGYSMGCISAILYLTSRLPQIYHNYRRKSTKGLAPFMFALTFTGNVTYGLSILLTSVDWPFLLSKMPWLVGSLGTVAFDFILILQTFLYSNKN